MKELKWHCSSQKTKMDTRDDEKSILVSVNFTSPRGYDASCIFIGLTSLGTYYRFTEDDQVWYGVQSINGDIVNHPESLEKAILAMQKLKEESNG